MLATAALAGGSQAAVITSISATAPTGPEVVTSQTGSTSGLAWYNTGVSAVRDVGQSFLAASSFTLDKITLTLGGSFNSVTATADFKLTLYSAASLSTAPSAVVTSQTGTFAFSNGSGGSGTFLTFDLADVALAAGTYYTFMLTLDDALTDNSLTVRQNASSTYADGYRWIFDGTSYTSSSTADLAFYVQAAAVPEPSTAALVVTALGAAALVRRKRVSMLVLQ